MDTLTIQDKRALHTYDEIMFARNIARFSPVYNIISDTKIIIGDIYCGIIRHDTNCDTEM